MISMSAERGRGSEGALVGEAPAGTCRSAGAQGSLRLRGGRAGACQQQHSVQGRQAAADLAPAPARPGAGSRPAARAHRASPPPAPATRAPAACIAASSMPASGERSSRRCSMSEGTPSHSLPPPTCCAAAGRVGGGAAPLEADSGCRRAATSCARCQPAPWPAGAAPAQLAASGGSGRRTPEKPDKASGARQRQAPAPHLHRQLGVNELGLGRGKGVRHLAPQQQQAHLRLQHLHAPCAGERAGGSGGEHVRHRRRPGRRQARQRSRRQARRADSGKRWGLCSAVRAPAALSNSERHLVLPHVGHPEGQAPAAVGALVHGQALAAVT